MKRWSVKMWNGKCDDMRKILCALEFMSAYSDTLKQFITSRVITDLWTRLIHWYFDLLTNWPVLDRIVPKAVGRSGCPYPEICWLGCLEVWSQMKWVVRWRSGGSNSRSTPAIRAQQSTDWLVGRLIGKNQQRVDEDYQLDARRQ